jgi:hypothetical protein
MTATDFLWKTCKLNGFNFRKAKDVIYCYCLTNPDFDYTNALELIEEYEQIRIENAGARILHSKSTIALKSEFDNIKGMSRIDFIKILSANKHNFINFSITAHKTFFELYGRIKEKTCLDEMYDYATATSHTVKKIIDIMNLEHEFEFLSANGQYENVDNESFIEKIVELKKKMKIFANEDERLVKTSNESITRQINELKRKCGIPSVNYYETVCNVLVKCSPDLKRGELRMDDALRGISLHLSRLFTNFLNTKTFEKRYNNPEITPDSEESYSRKLFMFFCFVDFVFRWNNRYKHNFDDRADFFDRFCRGLNSKLDECGYPYLYYADPYDWLILSCIVALYEGYSDVRGLYLDTITCLIDENCSIRYKERFNEIER